MNFFTYTFTSLKEPETHTLLYDFMSLYSRYIEILNNHNSAYIIAFHYLASSILLNSTYIFVNMYENNKKATEKKY